MATRAISLAVALAAALAVIVPDRSRAGEWRITPRVSASETWSDNIDLAPDGSEEHEFVTQVSPGVGISGVGRRLQLDFDYQVTGVHYARDTNPSRLDHRLQGSGNAELYEDRLFLDFSATVSQQNTTNAGRLSSDTVTGDANRRTVITYQVSPYVRQRLGPYADSTWRYRRASVENEGGLDTDVDELSLTVGSGKAFALLPWSVDARYRREDNSSGTESIYRSIDASTRYQFTRRYGIRVGAGYENNSLVSARDDTDGVTWSVSGIWTPTERTSVEAGYEHQFFGNSFFLDASHRMRKAVMRASYRETGTTTARRQLERQLFPLVDDFGNPIDNPGAVDVPVPIDDPTVTDETLISRRFDGSLALRGLRTTGRVGAYHERRDFDLSGGDERVFGLNASATRTLSRQTSATATATWQRLELVDGREDDRWSLDLLLSRRLFTNVTATLGYRHLRNDSTRAESEYSENRVTGTLSMLF